MKGDVTAERRNDNVCAYRVYMGDMAPQNSQVTAFHDQFIDGDDLELLGSMPKLYSFQDASRGKVSGMIVLSGDRAVADFLQILENRFLGKGPILDVEHDGQTHENAGDDYGQYPRTSPPCRAATRGAWIGGRFNSRSVRDSRRRHVILFPILPGKLEGS